MLRLINIIVRKGAAYMLRLSFFVRVCLTIFCLYIKKCMKKETKEAMQIYSAIGMLLAGVALSVAGFIVPPVGEIHDSVLWFFAQCLIYAGSIFGVGIYVNSKFDHLAEKFRNSLTSTGPDPKIEKR